MLPLTNKEYESYLNQENCHICKNKFEYKDTADKTYHEVRDHCHFTGKCIGAIYSICNLKYSLPEEIPVFFSQSFELRLSFYHKRTSERGCRGV